VRVQASPAGKGEEGRENLRGAIGRFVSESDWEQFHSPKNLAKALSVEVSEVVKHFQWLTQE
jgi:dCTP diphosphatase